MSGAKGTREIHQSDTECWAWFLLFLLRGLNVVCLNVLPPCWWGFCRKHFGVALSTRGPPLRPSNSCPLPLPYRSLQTGPRGSVRVAGYPVNVKRDTWNHQGEAAWFFFDLKHFVVECAHAVSVFTALKSAGISAEVLSSSLRNSTSHLLFTRTSPPSELQ